MSLGKNITNVTFGNTYYYGFLKSFSEQEAKQVHDSGGRYSALVVYDDSSRATILSHRNVSHPVVTVSFLDSEDRIRLRYEFRVFPQSGNKGLFLKRASYWEMAPGQRSPEMLWQTCYVFEESGETSVEAFKRGGRWLSRKVSYDVSTHWEEWPLFGEYGSISRLDRGQEWDPKNHRGLLPSDCTVS